MFVHNFSGYNDYYWFGTWPYSFHWQSPSFLGIPLATFSKHFNLTELKKGYFCHKMNVPEWESYIGPYPTVLSVEGKKKVDKEPYFFVYGYAVNISLLLLLLFVIVIVIVIFLLLTETVLFLISLLSPTMLFCG